MNCQYIILVAFLITGYAESEGNNVQAPSERFKWSAEEHEEVKRLESVLRDLEAMGPSQEESQLDNLKREEPASAVRKEKRTPGEINKLVAALPGYVNNY